MGKRRLQISDDEEEEYKPEEEEEEKEKKKKRKKEKRSTLEEEAAAAEDGGEAKKGKKGESEVEEPVAPEDAKPLGEVVKVTGKGRRKKKHYEAFEYDGNEFHLEDPVLLTPEVKSQKPYVAIIQDITQEADGSMMVTGQWFYRPEEAEKKTGGSWQACDTRELFYSFHRDEVPAESVMHKCVVHFVPLNKQLPARSQHPGFIVQKVYDTVERKLWKLTDKDYEDGKQEEINLLVEKTKKCLGDLPDIESEDAPADQDDSLKSKRHLRRKNMLPIDVSRDDDVSTRSDPLTKAETPGSCTSDVSEFYTTLATLKALAGDTYRDKWLEKLLQGVQFACDSKENAVVEDKEKADEIYAAPTSDRPQDQNLNVITAGKSIPWPDAVVPAITALEKVVHEALGFDFQKYNQKMRQLDFNLKNNVVLTRRLLKKELEPLVILNMSPNELKDGLTAMEKTTQEPEQSQRMQMTDARCSRCSEKNVGVADIIQGGSGDRYMLECIACGHTWYASRDAISSLTVDATSVVGNVGTAPWATAKFEDVEKKLVSPRESEKPSSDIFKKTTAPYMPVLETQRSFNRPKSEDPSASTSSAG